LNNSFPKVQKRIKETEIELQCQPRPGMPLLVLDIDYTIYDCSSTVERPEEQMRPFLHDFLTTAYKHYDIAIWSATSMGWIELKLKEMGITGNPNYNIVFCLDKTAMINAHSQKYGVYGIKPLAVVWERLSEHYTKERTIMFDDLSRNFTMNPENGLKIRPFKHAHVNRQTDTELQKLLKYLDLIKDVADFTTLNHDRWERTLEKGLPSQATSGEKRKREK